MKNRGDIRIICTTGDVFEVKHDSYDIAQIDELGLNVIGENHRTVKYFPLRNILQIEFIEVEK